MEVWELKIKMYLLKNIKKENSQNEICKIIDKSLLRELKYSQFHEENKFKNYCFNTFYPIERNGVYLEGNIYTVLLRTVDENLAEFFCKNLVNEYTDEIKILTIEKRSIKRKHIDKIYSICPAVIKSDDGYWKAKYTCEMFEQRLKVNLVKKYNQFLNTKINENFEFVNYIEFMNHKPIAVKYKNVSLLGDKVTMKIAENNMAQELAYFAIGTGILEMNSRGCGFIGYRWL